jgi:hypothetical protein
MYINKCKTAPRSISLAYRRDVRVSIGNQYGCPIAKIVKGETHTIKAKLRIIATFVK